MKYDFHPIFAKSLERPDHGHFPRDLHYKTVTSKKTKPSIIIKVKNNNTKNGLCNKLGQKTCPKKLRKGKQVCVINSYKSMHFVI